MNRLEKKCVVGSATLHGLLLVSVLVGSAFQSAKDPLRDMGQVVDLVNMELTDGHSRGGGNPKANPDQEAPAPAPVPPTPPTPQPPTPQPPQPEPVKPQPRQEVAKPEPVKTKEPKLTEKDKGDLPVPTQNSKSKDKEVSRDVLTSKTVKRSNQEIINQQREARARAQKAADEKYRAELDAYRAQQRSIMSAVDGVIGGTGKSLTRGAMVEPFGPGGQAFVNYGTFVRLVYERAWRVTPDLMDDDSSAVARVTIRRDGTVIAKQIVNRSSNQNLNRSVQRALEAVTSIGKSFPESTKDTERTFTIEFNLKTRKAIG